MVFYGQGDAPHPSKARPLQEGVRTVMAQALTVTVSKGI